MQTENILKYNYNKIQCDYQDYSYWGGEITAEFWNRITEYQNQDCIILLNEENKNRNLTQ